MLEVLDIYHVNQILRQLQSCLLGLKSKLLYSCLCLAIGEAVINFAGSENIIQHNSKGSLLTLMQLVKDQSSRFLSRLAKFTPATKLKICNI